MFADLRFIDTIDVAENQITEISKDAFKSIYLTKVSWSFSKSISFDNIAGREVLFGKGYVIYFSKNFFWIFDILRWI